MDQFRRIFLPLILMLSLCPSLCVQTAANHSCSNNRGQYTAYLKSATDNRWLHYNDEAVMKPEGSGIEVSVRCRPLKAQEKSSGATRVVKISGDKVLLHNPQPSAGAKEFSYSFHHCYFWDAKNTDLYKDIGEPLLRRALEGHNVSLVAFGQNESGKTHSIMGSVEEPGILSMMCQALFSVITDAAAIKQYFVTVSFVEVSDDYVQDLINPSGRDLNVRQHPQLGLYVDDMAEVVVSSAEELIRLCDQGNRIRKLTKADVTEEAKTSAILTVNVEQKSLQSTNVKGLRSSISFAVLAGSEHASKSEDAAFVSKSLGYLQQVISSLHHGTKEAMVPYRESKLTQILQNAFGGNSVTSFIAHISSTDSDFAETYATLKFATLVKSIHNAPKRNESDTAVVIKDLRDEINRLRDRLTASGTNMIDMPNSDDVGRMEELIKDLQIAKMQTWEEKQRLSDMFHEERRHHLSNKGILDWVLESGQKDSKEIQDKLTVLQKDKERLMIEYKEKRKVVDELKDVLQGMITDYSKLTETGRAGEEEGKQMVTKIHELKEKLKHENDNLKKLKQNLKDVQDRQKSEKEGAKVQTESLRGNMELRYKLEAEQREKMEKDNQATLADEIDRIKMETEQEKAEMKLKKGENRQYSVDDILKVEMEVLDLKGEKSAMAVKLRSIESEKKQLKKDIEELFKRQKEEMEIQQLQHFQTFRQYREVFEEQKAALEQRYRSLLEDSIQDAVYLSSRNQELMEENQKLHQEIAELKDKLSIAGRPESPP